MGNTFHLAVYTAQMRKGLIHLHIVPVQHLLLSPNFPQILSSTPLQTKGPSTDLGAMSQHQLQPAVPGLPVLHSRVAGSTSAGTERL